MAAANILRGSVGKSDRAESVHQALAKSAADELFEDKLEQVITEFSSEDAPIPIGLVFDTSGSMGSKLQKSR
jgi:hypothetical protein